MEDLDENSASAEPIFVAAEVAHVIPSLTEDSTMSDDFETLTTELGSNEEGKLGGKTESLQTDGTADFLWLFHLSRGGLPVPLKGFMESFVKCEEEFQRFHGKSINLEHDAFNRFNKVLEKKISLQELPRDAIFSWATQVRTFINLEVLNYNLSLMKHQKRAKNQLLQFTQYFPITKFHI